MTTGHEFCVVRFADFPMSPGSRILRSCDGEKARWRARLLLVCHGYAAVAVASSSWSMERICSRSSGVSWWPCTVFACRTASSRTSSSVPEMTIEQNFSDGKRRQSITLRCSAIVPPWERRDYRPVPTRGQPIWFLILQEGWVADFAWSGGGKGARGSALFGVCCDTAYAGTSC